MTRTTKKAAVARRLAALSVVAIALALHFSAAIVTRDSADAATISARPPPPPKAASSATSSVPTRIVKNPKAPPPPGAATAAAPADAEDVDAPPSAVRVAIESVVAEEGRSGGGVRDLSEDEMERVELPSSLFEVEDRDAAGGLRRQNYASLDAGATILDSAPETKSPTNLLVPDKDRYMLIPCEKPRKWVVVSLSEDVHADAVALANFEKFSSPVKDFIVLGSVTYPTDTWFVLGNFTAAPASGEQVFQLDSQSHVRYIKLRFLSHYGSEYYCTLSQLKVFGRTFTQVISQLEKSIDAEAALDPVALPAPLPAKVTVLPSGNIELPKSDADASKSAEHAQSDGDAAAAASESDVAAAASGLCHVHSSPANPTALVLYDAMQLDKYWHERGFCRLDEAAEAAKIAAEAAAPSDTPSKATADSPAKPVDQSGAAAPSLVPPASNAEANVTAASSSSSSSPSSSPSPDAASGNTTKASATSAAPPPTTTAATVQVPASSSAGASPQGLGRLESIFVRITKKIQALELNQSVFGRQMEDFQAQQRAATRALQTNQDAFAEQLQEIRALLTDLKGTVSKELSGTEKTLGRYGRILDEVQRENIALWNEMLVVREVITTMKAGILCALVLSAVIIAVYLLRLLFRCVAACKQRADLREWFWRMEHQASVQDSALSSPSLSGGARSPSSDVEAGALRVNRRQQFGSSWDDSAIERKTLLRDLLADEAPLKLRRHHHHHRSKKARSASLTYGPTIQRIVK